jgi:hypothetical protein
MSGSRHTAARFDEFPDPAGVHAAVAEEPHDDLPGMPGGSTERGPERDPEPRADDSVAPPQTAGEVGEVLGTAAPVDHTSCLAVQLS